MEKLTCISSNSKLIWFSNTSRRSKCNKLSCKKTPTLGLLNKMDKRAIMVISPQPALKAWWTSWRCSKTLYTDLINNKYPKSSNSNHNSNSNRSKLKWDRSRWIRAVRSCSMVLNWSQEVLLKIWQRVTAMGFYQLIKLSTPMVNNNSNITIARLSNKSIRLPPPTRATLRIETADLQNWWVKSSFKSTIVSDCPSTDWFVMFSKMTDFHSCNKQTYTV